MVYNGGLELIGNTPILKINNLIKDENSADIYVNLKNLIRVEVLKTEQR